MDYFVERAPSQGSAAGWRITRTDGHVTPGVFHELVHAIAAARASAERRWADGHTSQVHFRLGEKMPWRDQNDPPRHRILESERLQQMLDPEGIA